MGTVALAAELLISCFPNIGSKSDLCSDMCILLTRETLLNNES